MDVVYPYIKNNTGELEWSMKSLKNVEHDFVYVVHNYMVQDIRWANRTKYHNVIAKLKWACEFGQLSEDFIFMNDDIFLLKPQKVKIFNRGTLQNHLKERGGKDSYANALRFTASYLATTNRLTLDYELHTPFIFNKTKLNQLIDQLPLYSSRPLLIRSLYGNMYNIRSEHAIDVKNPDEFMGLPILSTSNKSFSGNIGNYIKSVLE